MNKPVEHLITQHLDIWTQATEAKSTAGRGTRGKINLLGIQKLRELILEMAVRGLLVLQDPNDEPASDLLKKIAAEKVQLIKDGKIKKSKPLLDISDDEKPFELPKGWEWARLEDIGETQTGSTPPKAKQHYFGSDIPFIKPSDLQNGYVDYFNEGLTLQGAEASGRIASSGSVLMVCIGTIGKVALIDRNCSFNQQINSVSPYLDIGKYLYRAMVSTYFVNTAWDLSSSTTIAILNKGKWSSIPLPLPPLAEQTRIVAKVDELMALCDALETQTLDSMATHQTLVETLLASLVQSDPSRSHVPRGNADPVLTASTNIGSHVQHVNQSIGLRFHQAWWLIEHHFDVLFTTEHSINTLKQTILQLAVMGKLVSQDPNDEPASELLKKIAAEKEQLIKDGKIKKTKPLPPITDAEKPFDLPNGWELVRFGEVINLISGQHLKPTEYLDKPNDKTVGYLTGPADFGDVFPTTTKFTELQKAVAEIGDILITCKGSGVGKLNIANERLAISRQLMSIQPFSKLDNNFVYLVSQSLEESIRENIVGIAIPGISREDVLDSLVWLPPKQEQTRIVAKVNQLMTLCNQIKTQLQTAQHTQAQLSQTITQEALA